MPIEFAEDLLENDNFKVQTDGNGDLIQEHKQTGATFKFDSTKNVWVPVEGLDLEGADIQNVGSVSTDETTINLAGGFGQNALDPDQTTEHTGNTVTVAGASFHTILDSSPVTVLWGQISGTNPTEIRVTYGDGSVDSITSNTNTLGADDDGTFFTAVPLPPMRDVTKLEFRNGTGDSRDYGYRVLTR